VIVASVEFEDFIPSPAITIRLKRFGITGNTELSLALMLAHVLYLALVMTLVHEMQPGESGKRLGVRAM